VSLFLQYFNVEKMGRLPNGPDALFTRRMGVFTKHASVEKAKGGTVFVIAGLGKPKRYFLWEAFTVEDVQHDGTQYTVSGPGWVLLPPQALAGKEFEAFKAACANFVTFRNIDELPYKDVLQKTAHRFQRDAPDAACETFCDGLIAALPNNGDAVYYRGTVRQRLGKAAAAREDFHQALALGTNFAAEANAALAEKDKVPGQGGKEPKPQKTLASQIVARGVFAAPAAGTKPPGVSDAAYRAVLLRRGNEEFRQRLLGAYGGKCAITGADAPEALEVALLTGDGTGPLETANALLLRGDVRTLFELNLIRVHPASRKVFVADSLKRGSYAKLMARQLRLPANADDRPSLEALQKRWDAAGGAKR
jgi:hypothetical protein